MRLLVTSANYFGEFGSALVFVDADIKCEYGLLDMIFLEDKAYHFTNVGKNILDAWLGSDIWVEEHE